jgi:hypothetical protein
MPMSLREVGSCSRHLTTPRAIGERLSSPQSVAAESQPHGGISQASSQRSDLMCWRLIEKSIVPASLHIQRVLLNSEILDDRPNPISERTDRGAANLFDSREFQSMIKAIDR